MTRSGERSRAFSHSMPFGAEAMDAGVRFRLWAPAERGLTLALERGGNEWPLVMKRLQDGWFELMSRDARAGDRYRYLLDDGTSVPDPASRFQPGGAEGPSEIIDPCSYEWQTADWVGRPWREAVIYEIHPGTFTPAGNYDGLRERLDYLLELGVTVLELMPVAAFGGRRGWGYDGVLPFAPYAVYGRPNDLKRLVDAAHERELMVFLDVVYNHFGPEGNYLPCYAPDFFTAERQTPWGDAIDFTHRVVRDFFVHNALYWLEEYRFDGLRFDAVDQIHDPSPDHILTELARTVRARIRARQVHLVLENDDNAARYLAREESPSNSPFHAGRARGRGEPASSFPLGRAAAKGKLEEDSSAEPKLYTAQWNDDFHHVAHRLASDEAGGYYADYPEPVAMFARSLAEGFVYQGEYSPYRERPRGERSAGLPTLAFVNFLQNHDQVGNRAFGERITALAPKERLRALYALLILSPAVPLLFMGEEWAATTPFLFFCDFAGELGDAVREGRREGFRRFPAFRDPGTRGRIPNPLNAETFFRSRLHWDERERPQHTEWRAFIARLIALRRSELLPRLGGLASGETERCGERSFRIVWPAADGGHWRLDANLGEAPVSLPPLPGRLVYGPGDPRLPAWSVRAGAE